jgi:hypothetical protein
MFLVAFILDMLLLLKVKEHCFLYASFGVHKFHEVQMQSDAYCTHFWYNNVFFFFLNSTETIFKMFLKKLNRRTV